MHTATGRTERSLGQVARNEESLDTFGVCIVNDSGLLSTPHILTFSPVVSIVSDRCKATTRDVIKKP